MILDLAILIEGAPGIGRSLLLREIPYLWSTQEILHKFKVLLVCLRDPGVQQMTIFSSHSVEETGELLKLPLHVASDYLSENNSEDLVLLLDGCNKYPERL